MLRGEKVIFSGMQPTSLPTLGNYLGAIKNWVSLQNDYKCLYCVVDMHSITVRLDPAELRKTAKSLVAFYLAAGLDPERNILYFQSHVPAHAELAWVLSCHTYMGELSRMTQFKEKSQKHAENINAGLFTYPVLMAADILLFQADLVPVGDDQRQHLEITRDIAQRFNNLYGEVFTVPEVFVKKGGARIMGLQNPEQKMSKSEGNENDTIFMLDEPARIINKIKRAVTDSDNEVRYSDDKPGIKNLLEIYSAVTGKPVSECEAEFSGKGYGFFKQSVGEAVAAALEPIQKRYGEIIADKAYIDSVIKSGAEKAADMAAKTLEKVYKKLGFIGRIR